MTVSRTSLLGLSALLPALGGCAAPLDADGGPAASSPARSAAVAPAAPGPGWFLLGTHGESAVFMDLRSTLRVGSSAFIMLVASKRQPAVLPGGVTVGSLKERIEIDCERTRYRRHDGTVHPDREALGPVLGRVGQDRWRDVSPNTVMAAVSLAVCSAAAPPSAPAPPPKPRGDTFRT